MEWGRCWRKHDRCGACRAFASFLDLFRHKDSQCIGMQEIIQYSEIIGADSEGFGMDLNGIHEGFEL